MGIKDLLPNLKSIQRKVHISKYEGKQVAIDSYCWLHKGLYNCAMEIELHEDMTKSPLSYSRLLQYLRSRIKLLRKHRITPIFVFDGAPLKIKAKTNKTRSE